MQYEIGVHLNSEGNFIPYNDVMREILLEELEVGENYVFKVVKVKDKKWRTLLQNNALWLYFTKLAKALNDAGLDMRRMLRPEIDIPWNKDSIHDHLWIGLQEAMTNKTSTKKLETHEVSQVYDVLNRHLVEKHNVSLAFPSMDSQMNEYDNR